MSNELLIDKIKDPDAGMSAWLAARRNKRPVQNTGCPAK